MAGMAYFGVIFALGFALGLARAVALNRWPGLDPALAIMLELPFMLAASWVCCGWLVRRCAVPTDLGSRMAMGVAAFTLLMMAEAALALWLLGRPLADHAAAYQETAHAIGLAGQIAFAAFPLMRR